nr:MAG TPA: hypothetical protein [Caudoviricetes sp.]
MHQSQLLNFHNCHPRSPVLYKIIISLFAIIVKKNLK